MDQIQAALQTEIYGVTVQAMLLALAAIFAGFVGGWIIERGLRKARDTWSDRTVRHAVLEALTRPAGWVLKVGGIWLAINLFPLPKVSLYPISELGEADLSKFVNSLFQAATVALVAWFGVRLTDSLCHLWALKARETEGTFDDQLVPIVRKTGRVFFVVTGGVMMVQNLGYSVGSLLAGLGIGGAALAFASKDTVANLFGAIVVFVDRPFQIGDWVEIGSTEGTVEEVGLRVTRIRTFANSLVVLPNAVLTTSPIQNWSRMKKRRIKMNIGLTYDTNPEQMHEAVTAIREIIKNDDRLDQSFSLVNFNEFGPSSLDIFLYLFTNTTDWTEYMQVRQEFMLEIMKAMSGLGLEFAFPTQTLHLEGLGDRQPPGAPRAMLRQSPP